MRRALVTGGSGFIGQYLVSDLLARGDAVRILDVQPPRRTSPEAVYIQGSILDAARVGQALEGIEDVYHLAALPGMWAANKADFEAINLRGTEIMLAAARDNGVSRFLHCSTGSILSGSGDSETDGRSSAIGAYTRSKLAAEQAARRAAADGRFIVIVAPTLPIGPHDHNLTPPTLMLRNFLRWRIHRYIDVRLNLVDVHDVARGMTLAMEHGRSGQSYALGGENLSVAGLLDLISLITGRRRPRLLFPSVLALISAAVTEFIADHVSHRVPEATVEGVRIAMRSHAISIDKSRRELGYAPQAIESAMRAAIAWIEETFPVATA